ncbi:hypothetical protein RMATCC62417_14490 [Rhizopus microsporus]|nr:hypothetical protein RMATCC62417_14490 [Rhizopus microsporus]
MTESNFSMDSYMDDKDDIMTYLDEDYMSTTSNNSSSWTLPLSPSMTPTSPEPTVFPEPQYFPFMNYLQGCYQHDVSQMNAFKEIHLMLPSSTLVGPKQKRGRKKRNASKDTSAVSLKPPVPILPAIKQEEDGHKIDEQLNREKVAASLAKRQERLIKNRAAALLSRKRKREHLHSLEQERMKLLDENSDLKEQMNILERENMQLRQKLKDNNHSHGSSHGSHSCGSHGILLMIILYCFALFISFLPKSKTMTK